MLKDAFESLCFHGAVPIYRFDRLGDSLPDGVLARPGSTRFRHGWPTKTLAASTDDTRLASGNRVGGLCLWKLPTGRLLWRAKFPGRLDFVIIPPDGSLLAVGGQDAVRLFDAAPGREIRLPWRPGPNLAPSPSARSSIPTGRPPLWNCGIEGLA